MYCTAIILYFKNRYVNLDLHEGVVFVVLAYLYH